MDVEGLHGAAAVGVGFELITMAGQRCRIILPQRRFVLDDRDQLFHGEIIADRRVAKCDSGSAWQMPRFARFGTEFATVRAALRLIFTRSCSRAQQSRSVS